MRWQASEYAAYQWLLTRCRGTKRAKYGDPYDAIYKGCRIEIKCSEFDGKKWRFNIHRHGKLKEHEVDVYVLRLEGCKIFGGKAALHLVLPAPIGSPTVQITLRSLFSRYAQYFNRLDLINQEVNFVCPRCKSYMWEHKRKVS
jgi:hypothetical protein